MEAGSHGARVTLDHLEYKVGVLTPPDKPHCFAYHISIWNEGNETISIYGRKWVVRESSGDITAVEGDGVVGEFPILAPGEHFSYNSYHMIHALSAVAQGSYLGSTDKGAKVILNIPKFDMVVPSGEVGYC